MTGRYNIYKTRIGGCEKRIKGTKKELLNLNLLKKKIRRRRTEGLSHKAKEISGKRQNTRGEGSNPCQLCRGEHGGRRVSDPVGNMRGALSPPLI